MTTLSQNTRLVIWIESGRAIHNMCNIIDAAYTLHETNRLPLVDAAVFGSDDFCADIGM